MKRMLVIDKGCSRDWKHLSNAKYYGTMFCLPSDNNFASGMLSARFISENLGNLFPTIIWFLVYRGCK